MEADLQELPVEEQLRFLLGSELSFNLDEGGDEGSQRPTQAALRAGLQAGLLKEEALRLSLGASLGFGPHFTLDYALQDSGVLGQTHRFSLSLHFDPGAPASAHVDGPAAAELSAPYALQVTPQLDGLLISWQHDDKAVQGYNLYSDYGVLVERLNDAPLGKTTQRFIKVTRSRSYNFYVRPIGADGQEGPPSQIKTVVVK
jgi:hypothetical protein